MAQVFKVTFRLLGFTCIYLQIFQTLIGIINLKLRIFILLSWWRNSKYKIGNLSQKIRNIRIINTLTRQDDIISVCQEETIYEILDRYKEINEHAESYTWKRLQRVLDMEQTLTENDIPDETADFLSLELDPETYIPAIHLYFNDDLTEA
jgi:hypothetical protein